MSQRFLGANQVWNEQTWIRAVNGLNGYVSENFYCHLIKICMITQFPSTNLCSSQRELCTPSGQTLDTYSTLG
jgi:hypothetical protein